MVELEAEEGAALELRRAKARVKVAKARVKVAAWQLSK